MKTFKVGIIGAGIGRQHAAAFQELPANFRVAAICDVAEERARVLANEYGIDQVTGDYRELLDRPDLDIIDICTPSFLHVDQALKALAAGKNVILEKPAAGSLAELDALIEAEQSSGRWVLPVFQQRFGVGLQKLIALRDLGICGRAYLTTAETAWRRKAEYYATWHGRWATELGGPLVTLGIHAMDCALAVLGPARRVTAQLATLVNPVETEDTAVITAQMADGSLYSHAVTTGSAHEVTRHHFCFQNLSAESGLVPYVNTSEPWRFNGDTPAVDRQIHEALQGFIPAPEGLLGEFSRCAAAMQAGAPLPVTLADARSVIELITAIYRSDRTGQAVNLPIPKDDPYYIGWQPAG